MIISGMDIRITGEGLPEMPPTVYMVEAMAEIAVELKVEPDDNAPVEEEEGCCSAGWWEPCCEGNEEPRNEL